MTKSIELHVAQTILNEIIAALGPNDEVIITQDSQPVARLLASPGERGPRKAGNCKGMINIMTDDDEHLQDFAEYMP